MRIRDAKPDEDLHMDAWGVQVHIQPAPPNYNPEISVEDPIAGARFGVAFGAYGMSVVDSRGQVILVLPHGAYNRVYVRIEDEWILHKGEA